MTDAFAEPTLDISLREFIDLIRRRRAVILKVFLVVLAGGFAMALTLKPTYRATTRILVEGKSLSIGQYDANNPLSSLFMQDSGHDIATQVEAIQGEQVLSDAYDEAGIPRGSIQVRVTTVPSTDIIDIAIDSSVPTYAEKMASTLPKTYLRYVNGNRKTEVDTALKFAQDRLKEETQRLLTAQLDLQKVRLVSRIFSVDGDRKARSTAADEAVGELNRAASVLAGTEAQLAAMIAQRNTLPKAVETQTETTNPEIAGLQAGIAALKTQRSALSVLFKPTSSKVEVIDAQIADLKARLTAMPGVLITRTRKPNEAVTELDRRIDATRIDLANVKATLATSKARADHTQQAMLAFNTDEVKQSQIEAEVESARADIALFTKSAEELSLRAKATHDPVTVLSPASKATKSGPRQMQVLLSAAAGGLILGFCLMMLQEYLDDRMNSSEDVSRILKAPLLGFVPFVEREEQRILSVNSDGSLVECYRGLRSNVRFATVDMPASSILITSAIPEEGKSVTAVNLAIALALDGVRVILIDLDLRRPTLHKKLNLNQSPGITNVLVGHTSLDDALQATEIPGLCLLTSGPMPPNPAELLNSQAMRTLHRELKARAEVVVIDSPPFLATADAQVLASLADGIVFVVQLGKVKKAAVRRVKALTDQAHGKLLGVVFNKIDTSLHRDDYYYGYYRYYSEYQQEGHTKRRRASTTDFDSLLPLVHPQDSSEAATMSNGNAF